VLEIGVGTGLNLPWYSSVGLLVGVDPNPDMLAVAKSRRGSFRGSAQLVLANGEALPFRDGSFETVVGTLVFCTIPDPLRALQEAARVLAPGGVFSLLEHVRSPLRLAGRVQDWITPVWSAVCDGCHPNRETIRTVEAAGFRIVRCDTRLGGLVVRLEAVHD
jgi:ubiquinone/menaquinone biosynthesis C-methylase UbiE